MSGGGGGGGGSGGGTPRLIQSRELRSDVALVNLGAGSWIDFRDVFQVDGTDVRDHQQRVLDLFLHPAADSLNQARRLADESARFNIGRARRTMNIPTFALAFLTRSNQFRSRFAIDSTHTVNGVTTVVLRFAEQAKPRLIQSADNAAATGRFWIDASTGRVNQTELTLSTTGADAKVTVAYALHPAIKLWTPVSMDESYQIPVSSSEPEGETDEGHATYANFRAFRVDVSVIIR